MLGLDVAVGYALAYLGRKVRRAAGRVDMEVDVVVDTAMERVHRVVAGALGEDRLLERLSGTAAGGPDGADGEVPPAVREQIRLALAESLREQPALAVELERALLEVRRALEAAGSNRVDTITGNVEIRADRGGFAALQTGDVRVANPWSPDAHLA
jgi:hypothetical protein